MLDLQIINKTIDALNKNNFDAYFVDNKNKALELVDSFISKDDIVTYGGSMTLFETGIMDYLKNKNDIKFLDRNKDGNTLDDIQKIYREAFTSDVYFTSSNAITEDGYLYNVDGNSNRISAMMFGPKNVIVVAGYNKIVKTKQDAIDRVRNYVAPKNAQRLNMNTPCVKTGKCMDCMSKDRICCNYAFFGKQRIEKRIKVIIIGEEYGY